MRLEPGVITPGYLIDPAPRDRAAGAREQQAKVSGIGRPAGNRCGIAIFLGHAKRLRGFRTLHAGCVIPVKLSAEQPISKQRLVVSRAGGERAQDALMAAACFQTSWR